MTIYKRNLAVCCLVAVTWARVGNAQEETVSSSDGSPDNATADVSETVSSSDGSPDSATDADVSAKENATADSEVAPAPGDSKRDDSLEEKKSIQPVEPAPAQEEKAANPKEKGTSKDKGLSSTVLAKANNPLADLTALNVHNYYLPESGTSNTFVRFAKPLFKGRMLVRITLPIHTMPHPTEDVTMSGLGDLNVFAAVNIISKPTATLGIGPLGNFSTAVGTNDLREMVGSKNQLGGALLGFKAISPVVALGALVTYQHTLGSVPDLRDQNLMVVQPFGMVQLGKGLYLRSGAMWTFDFENDYYTLPFSLGIGKIIKAGKVVFNGFIEPTFTVFSTNPNQVLFQLFTGLNLQFM